MESCSSNLQKNQRISRSCICGHGRKTAMLYGPPCRTGNSCRTFDGLFIRFAPFCSFRQQKAKTPQNRDSEAKKAKKMVHPTRFELMTFYSGGRRSIQLSYGCPCPLLHNIFLFYRNKSPQTQKSSKFFLQSNLGPPPFFRKQYTTTRLSRNVPIPKKSKKSRKIIANIFFQNILYFELSGRMWFFGKVFLTWKSVIQEAVTFPFNYPVFIPFFR